MRILILALTFGLGLTLNGKAENSIAKKDSIHFIDGVLIMANDTISLDEFLFLAKRRYGRTASSQNDEATVIYLRQAIREVKYLKLALQQMTFTEKTGLIRKNKKMIAGFSWADLGAVGAAAGTLGALVGLGLIATGEVFGVLAGLALSSAGIITATISLGVAVGSDVNKNTPTMSSAHHKLEADNYIDKAVNSYNK